MGKVTRTSLEVHRCPACNVSVPIASNFDVDFVKFMLPKVCSSRSTEIGTTKNKRINNLAEQHSQNGGRIPPRLRTV